MNDHIRNDKTTAIFVIGCAVASAICQWQYRYRFWSLT